MIILVSDFFVYNFIFYLSWDRTYLLCAVVLHSAALILLCLGMPPGSGPPLLHSAPIASRLLWGHFCVLVPELALCVHTTQRA